MQKKVRIKDKYTSAEAEKLDGASFRYCGENERGIMVYENRMYHLYNGTYAFIGECHNARKSERQKLEINLMGGNNYDI